MKSKLKLSPAKSKEVDHIIDVVEKHTGISRKDILGRNRMEPIVDARHIVWYLCAEHLGIHLAMLGRHFDCHHAAIIHSLKRVACRIVVHRDRYFTGLINEIAKELDCESVIPVMPHVERVKA